MITPKIDTRPWGHFYVVWSSGSNNGLVKIITIHPHCATSLQYHHKRKERWIIMSGNGEITIGKKITQCAPGDIFSIEALEPHRVKNTGDTNLIYTEVALGEFDERDIVRLEDDFGRI